MSVFRQKKELNQEINLTPFIDLLSTIVCFLLISAVWVQIGSLEIKQSKGTEATTKKSRFEMDLKFKSPSLVHLSLKKNGRRIQSFKVKGKDNQAMARNLDSKLEEWLKTGRKGKKKQLETALKTHRGRYRGQGGSGGSQRKIEMALVTPKRGVSYGDMVAVLDVLRKNRIVNIGVIPIGGI